MGRPDVSLVFEDISFQFAFDDFCELEVLISQSTVLLCQLSNVML